MKKLLRRLFAKEYKYTLRNGLPLTVRTVSERQALRYAVKRDYEAFLTQEREKARRLQIMNSLKVPDELADNVLHGMRA